MFLIDDGGKPDIVAKLFIVMFLSWQSYNIQFQIAIIVFIDYPPCTIKHKEFSLLLWLHVILLGYA